MYISCNEFKELDLSEYINLKYFFAWGNKLAELNLSTNQILEINLDKNKLTSFALGGNNSLKELSLAHNELSHFNFTGASL